jgi:two-component system, chemotaxis family, chemotaxis protein CheY
MAQYLDTDRILIIEDDELTREGLSELLQAEGYKVSAAAGGFEAMYLLERDRPAVILLDLIMGIMSGREFRQRQVADPRFAHIPVILISGTPDLSQQAEQLGVGRYLPKPFEPRQLLALVRESCRSGLG